MATKRKEIKNVYDTNDPRTLLNLKRLEADALLDLLRTINHEDIKLGKLFMIARNMLRAQLGVMKMAFYYREVDRWEEAIRVGFDATLANYAEELLSIDRISEVQADSFPLLYKLGVEYVIPILHKKEAVGYFLVADFADSEVEAQNDLIFIETIGNILYVSIRNKQLFKEKMERELIMHELSVAERIQQQLLISDFTGFHEIDVHGINIPHHRVGGDFYDVIKKGKGTTFVAIGDVSGKGIGAALLMSNLQANLRALCAQFDNPVDIVRELNNVLSHLHLLEKFITFFITKIDSVNKKISYVNAGHNYPLFLSGDNIRPLEKGCLPLGIMPEIVIETETLSFVEKDLLFMYTDGLIEQENAEQEMFGQDRILEIIKSVKDQSSEMITSTLYDHLREYAGNFPAADDITVLNVKFYA